MSWAVTVRPAAEADLAEARDWYDRQAGRTALTGAERGRIITDAYFAAHPDDPIPVTIPIGITATEALAMGYLRYRIEALVRKEDDVTAKQITDAMKGVGGVYMQVGTEKQLRFATKSQAETAYRALNAMLPSPVWTLVLETSSGEQQ